MIERWANDELWSVWRSDLYGNHYVSETGLSLPEAQATDGRRLVVPQRYAIHRGHDVLAAYRVAEPALAEIRQSHDSLTFAPAVAHRSTPMHWSFTQSCEEWRAAGYVPGIISVQIDVLDLSIWSDEEQELAGLLSQPDP